MNKSKGNNKEPFFIENLWQFMEVCMYQLSREEQETGIMFNAADLVEEPRGNVSLLSEVAVTAKRILR